MSQCWQAYSTETRSTKRLTRSRDSGSRSRDRLVESVEERQWCRALVGGAQERVLEVADVVVRLLCPGVDSCYLQDSLLGSAYQGSTPPSLLNSIYPSVSATTPGVPAPGQSLHAASLRTVCLPALTHCTVSVSQYTRASTSVTAV